MNSEENQYLFDRYLSGELTSEEENAFDQRVEQDSAFKKEFQEYQEFSKQIELAFLKEDLEEIHQKTIKSQRIFSPQYGLVAASIVLIGLIGLLWLQQNSKNGDSLFKEYFIKDPGLPTVMGVTEAVDFQNAMVAYKVGNNQNAREIWMRLDQENPKNDTLQFYIAMSFLNEKNYSEAERWLSSVELQPKSRFYEEAIWYRALININDDENEKALQRLEKIKNFPKAKELIQQLEK